MKIKHLLIILLLFAALSPAQQSGSFSDQFPIKGKIVMNPDPLWPVTSLKQLITAAPLIISGTVLSVPPSVQVGDNRQPHPHLETRSLIAVDAILKGAVPNQAGIIVLTQAGGKLGELEMVVPSDPLVQEGERYILFLMSDDDNQKARPNTSGMPRYCVVGIWSGKAKVVDRKIAFSNGADARLREYDNMDATEFTQKIRDMIANPEKPANPAPLNPGIGRKN